ncbi:hypothetical protein KUCAC02_034836 [Chaenocephalus aceratus]|nr:hypothetical protein KUCAC02_034836 [Chaenocephalus aceratus]
MKAEPGQDVTLQCNGPTDAAVTVLEWKRPGLEDSVFYFRDNRLIESIQDPRYRGRVQLKDPEMKNGDASVLLKNVDIEDTGTYKCWVTTLSNDLLMRELVHSVLLVVSEGPKKEINDEQPGGSRGYVVLVLVCFLVGVGVVVVGFVVKSNMKRPLESFDEEELCKMNTGHFDDLLTPDCSPSPASKLNNPLEPGSDREFPKYPMR